MLSASTSTSPLRSGGGEVRVSADVMAMDMAVAVRIDYDVVL